MKTIKLTLVAASVFAFSACSGASDVPQINYSYNGQLEDVSGGKAFGAVNANFAERYDLLATFANLPATEGSDFYEGWIVKKVEGGEDNVISTGIVRKIEDIYTNSFLSKDDLTDHDFYVLTLEPNDGDPAPAKHILEGTLKKK